MMPFASLELSYTSHVGSNKFVDQTFDHCLIVLSTSFMVLVIKIPSTGRFLSSDTPPKKDHLRW